MKSNAARHALPLLSLAALLAPRVGAQSLSVPSPVQPLSSVVVTLTNDTGGILSFPAGCALRLLRHTSELAGEPAVPMQACDGILAMLPGATHPITLQAPADPGTYVLWFPFGGGAAASFDVTVPSAAARSIQFFPAGLLFPQDAHEVDFAAPAGTRWVLANSGPATHAFAGADRIDVTAPGGAAPVATLPLAGASIGAGETIELALPIAGLAPAPYEVSASFTDGGAPVRVESGIRPAASRVDLHLARGRALAPGGSVDLAVTYVDRDLVVPAQVVYGVVIGRQPGTTPLPGGALIPVFPDGLVLDSLATGLGGLLTGHLGTMTNAFPSPAFEFLGTAQATLAHPGLPGLAGLRLRAAAFVLDPTTGAFGASQPEPLALQ